MTRTIKLIERNIEKAKLVSRFKEALDHYYEVLPDWVKGVFEKLEFH